MSSEQMSARERIARILDGMDITVNLTGEDYRIHRDDATDRIIAIVREALLSEEAVNKAESVSITFHAGFDAIEAALDTAFGEDPDNP